MDTKPGSMPSASLNVAIILSLKQKNIIAEVTYE